MTTMIRPTFIEIYMDLAKIISKRSTCKRLQVGTVITSTDFRKVLAVGYNGNATGLFNGCDRDEPSNCGCLHSEENSIINCDAPRSIEKIVFVTHLPCVQCAKRIINLGNVKKVFYNKEYRILDSIELLKSVGIEIVHLPDAETSKVESPTLKFEAKPHNDDLDHEPDCD
jgi:dCMP deaminase